MSTHSLLTVPYSWLLGPIEPHCTPTHTSPPSPPQQTLKACELERKTLQAQNGASILLAMRWANKIRVTIKKNSLGCGQMAVIPRNEWLFQLNCVTVSFCGVSHLFHQVWLTKYLEKRKRWAVVRGREVLSSKEKHKVRLAKLFPIGEFWIKERKWGQIPRSYMHWLQIAAILQNHFFLLEEKKSKTLLV